MVMKIMNNFLKEYCKAKEYANNKNISFKKYKSLKNYNYSFRRIGYIVATCSPVTKAHIELANKAIDDLNLDVLYFIIWPFYYIPDFHSNNMLKWIKEQKHYNWDIRISLLEKAIFDSGNNKIKILYEAKDWYIESEKEFNKDISESFFWTGSWYVIRKLQTYINKENGGGNLFYFIAGSDQFNPNIYNLFDNSGEKVWKDYSISQQLALHNVYAVERDYLEFFKPPKWFENQIYFSKKL